MRRPWGRRKSGYQAWCRSEGLMRGEHETVARIEMQSRTNEDYKGEEKTEISEEWLPYCLSWRCLGRRPGIDDNLRMTPGTFLGVRARGSLTRLKCVGDAGLATPLSRLNVTEAGHNPVTKSSVHASTSPPVAWRGNSCGSLMGFCCSAGNHWLLRSKVPRLRQ